MINTFKKISTSLAVLAFIIGSTLGVAPVGVSAQDIGHGVKCGSNFNLDEKAKDCYTSEQSCKDQGGSDCGKYSSDLNGLVTSIVNILSVIVGVVAVIMIIIGGFKYITSSGDSNNVSSAKNTIVYAIVGLIIVALAQVIVRFVLSKVA